MGRYLARRTAAFVAIIFVVSLGAFLLVHLLPGNPASAILQGVENKTSIAKLNAQLGLNKPLWEQYFIWMGNVLRGNLGQSFITHTNVTTIIRRAFPIDLELIVISQIMAFAIAVPLAMISARRPGSLFDQTSTGATFGMLAMPPFVLAPVFSLLFSVELHWFPGPGAYAATHGLISNLNTMWLPSIVLALGSIVLYYRLLRNDLISTLQEDFIVMARSKGQGDVRILFRHALRPSSVSLMASAGISFASLIGGTFIVEYLLGIPGLGFTLIHAINQTDYVTIQGIVLVIAIAVVVFNFIIDFLFYLVDPRIAHD